MKLIFRIVAPVLVIFIGIQWQLGRLNFARSPAGLSGNTCEGKKFCAMVYLAPWCPHCQSAIPYTQEILARSRGGDLGVRVVVGLGDPSQNMAMAQKIAMNVQLDNDKKIASEMGIQGVPAYFVFDKEGTKILEGMESLTWIMEKFQR